MRLFLQRARQIQPRFAPNDEEMAAIVAICHLVEGMPLALILAVAMLREQSCMQIAHALEEGAALLAPRLRDLPERHRSIRAVFAHSWRLLSPEEQEVFCALSLFRGGFLIEAAEEVAKATPMLLAALIDKSLSAAQPGRALRYTRTGASVCL